MPSLVGHRLTVFDIVSGCHYEGIDNYIETFKIQRVEVLEALAYCKNLDCQKNFKDSDQYCEGCVLDTLHSGRDETPMSEIEINGEKFMVSDDMKSIFLGDKSDYEEEDFGIMGWVLADEVLNKIGNR